MRWGLRKPDVSRLTHRTLALCLATFGGACDGRLVRDAWPTVSPGESCDRRHKCREPAACLEAVCRSGHGAACVTDADCIELCIGLVCSPASCGDGVQTREAGELCDDGNTVTELECEYGTPSCTVCDADCTSLLTLVGRTCGDAIIDPEEECDDGNTVSELACAYATLSCTACNADCTSTLTLLGPTCGDGHVDSVVGEVCDSGFQDPCGSCNSDCTGPGAGNICGDGVVCPEVEQCDDGNDVDRDGCCSCTICPFRLDVEPEGVFGVFDVKLLPGGGFQLAWHVHLTTGASILSRRFDSSAEPIGLLTTVATGNTAAVRSHGLTLARAGDGTSVVAWDNGFPGAGQQEVMLSRFVDDESSSDTIMVNTVTALNQGGPTWQMMTKSWLCGSSCGSSPTCSCPLASRSGSPRTARG